MKRFNETLKGYKFDRLIFGSILLIIVGLVFFIMQQNNFDFSAHPYVKCYDEKCFNPFYIKNNDMLECKQTLNILWFIPIYATKDCRDNCEWCKQEFISRGEYGSKMKQEGLMNNLGLIFIVLLVVGLLLNHKLHNKGKQFDIEIPITKNKRLTKDMLLKLIDNKEDDLNDK